MQTKSILDRYRTDRPAHALSRIKQAFSRAGSVKRKESLIRRLAIAEKRALKVLDLFSKQTASALIH